MATVTVCSDFGAQENKVLILPILISGTEKKTIPKSLCKTRKHPYKNLRVWDRNTTGQCKQRLIKSQKTSQPIPL